ncbi:hypothetical protein V6N13_055434 [Hibiscus sabdariffa]|uniref:Uncharacterized protein n=2 Tax=Hibiscus sabdariffa TaxID=183260 RepID=A0ABR2NTG7_9ROSI
MGISKAWFPLILCCFLLASLVFFPPGIASMFVGRSPPHCSVDVCRPRSPEGPGSRASETSHASSQVNSATPKLEKQKAP